MGNVLLEKGDQAEGGYQRWLEQNQELTGK